MPDDLNRKIAEKLGWTNIAQLGEGLMCGTNPNRPASHGAEQVPAYDTDPAASNELKRMLRDAGYSYRIEYHHDDRLFWVYIWDPRKPETNEDWEADGDAEQLVFARAAMAWLESKELAND